MLTSRPLACSRVATTCPAAKNGDQTIAGPIVHADSAWPVFVGWNRYVLSPRPEHPVVVHEIDVAVEGERAQVGEVVEAVALEPRAELQLQRETDGEERGQDETGGPRCRVEAHDRRDDAAATSRESATTAPIGGVRPEQQR